MRLNLICGDSAKELQGLPPECIDLTVTSPPYDSLRSYEDCTWNEDVFKAIAKGIFRVTRWGGVVVWIVNDATVKGSETGTSFRQALYFMECGFNLHDTMIWAKDTMTFPDPLRYGSSYEYMFVFSKGKPKTFNPIRDRKNKWHGCPVHGTSRGVDGNTFRKSNDKKTQVKEYGARFNVWNMPGEKCNRTGHPAPFPVRLAKDHILSWSNEGDTVMDPFMGSGTTGVACSEMQRNFVGIEIAPRYYDIAKRRIEEAK